MSSATTVHKRTVWTVVRTVPDRVVICLNVDDEDATRGFYTATGHPPVQGDTNQAVHVFGVDAQQLTPEGIHSITVPTPELMRDADSTDAWLEFLKPFVGDVAALALVVTSVSGELRSVVIDPSALASLRESAV